MPGFEDDQEFDPAIFHRHVQAMPRDAERMGLDRNTEEGALIAMAGSLNSGKASHRIVAWLLVASLVLPVLLTIATLLL